MEYNWLVVYAVVMTLAAVFFCIRSFRMDQLRLKAAEAVEYWRGELWRLQNQAPADQLGEVERLRQQKRMLIRLVQKWCPQRSRGGMVAFPVYLYPAVVTSESSMYALQGYVDGANAAALAIRKKKEAGTPLVVEDPPPSPVKEQPPMPDDGIG